MGHNARVCRRVARTFAALTLALLVARAAAQNATHAPLSEDDVAEAQVLVGACLGHALPPLAHEQSFVLGGLEHLMLNFSPRGSAAGEEGASYSATLIRAPGEGWRLRMLGVSESFATDATRLPVSLGGVFEAGVADAIVAVLLGKWAEQFPDVELRLAAIQSSVTPLAACAGTESRPANVSYVVNAYSGPPDTGTDYPVTFRLVPGPGDALLVVDAQWTGETARLDGSMRQRLAALVDAHERSEHERAVAQALAALPAEFAHAQVLGSNFYVQGDGRIETLNVMLDQVDLSPRRQAFSAVLCVREVGVHADWRCRHDVNAVVQTVSAQAQPVQVALMNAAGLFTEGFVERVVAEARAQAPRFLTGDYAEDGLEIIHLTSTGGRIWALARIAAEQVELSIGHDGDEIRVLSLTRRGSTP